MEIVVLVKPSPDGETRLRANPAGTALDTDGVKWVLAGYDESAVEQALLLKESIPGSKVRAVTFAPAPRGEEVLRSSLALGCDAATWVEQPTDLVSDPILTARALAVALRRAPYDLVLGGKQAGDDEQGLVTSALGELLGSPSFSGITDLRWDSATQRFSFRRAVEGGSEAVRSGSPLVVGLQQAWNDPRTAKLPNILRSRKAPIDKIPWAEVSGAAGSAGSRPTGFRLPAPRTGAKMIAFKTPEEAAAALVRLLREEAKVFP